MKDVKKELRNRVILLMVVVLTIALTACADTGYKPPSAYKKGVIATTQVVNQTGETLNVFIYKPNVPDGKWSDNFLIKKGFTWDGTTKTDTETLVPIENGQSHELSSFTIIESLEQMISISFDYSAISSSKRVYEKKDFRFDTTTPSGDKIPAYSVVFTPDDYVRTLDD